MPAGVLMSEVITDCTEVRVEVQALQNFHTLKRQNQYAPVDTFYDSDRNEQ
jgi:hypothetical protein